jgi:hypothetical protein
MATGLIAAALSLALLGVSGAAASAPSPAGCAAASVQAIRRGVTLTELPSACRGLSAAELRQAATTAIREASDHFGKARRRHLAFQASAKVGYLFKIAAREVTPGPARPERPSRSPAAASASHRVIIPAGGATLAAWLLTVFTGSYLLFGWMIRGRRRRRPAGQDQRRPVIWLHAGLALTGLVIWTGFVASGWTPAAWVATCLLPLVLGLGLATLLAAIPDSAPRSATRRAPVLVIAAHGAFATATMLLALLAALAAR